MAKVAHITLNPKSEIMVMSEGATIISNLTRDGRFGWVRINRAVMS